MAKYSVGQKVVYSSEIRKKVGLPKSVEATITEVYEEGLSNPVYSIEWLPTGRATVAERELSEAT